MQENQHSLLVKFYRRPWQNFYKSTLEGRPIFEDKDFVQITIPGNQLTEIDTIAEAHHVHQYPVEWARYQNAINNEDAGIEGTPLTAWSVMLPSVAENLKYHKFFTVEQIASASDSQLKAIEFICGTNPMKLRDQAKYYLVSTKERADIANELAEKELIKQQAEDTQNLLKQALGRIASLEADAQELKLIKEKKSAKAARERERVKKLKQAANSALEITEESEEAT